MRISITALVASFFVFGLQEAPGDNTWLYAVQLSSIVQTSPPRITLNWPQDTFGASRYTVYRKTLSSYDWGTGTVLPGSATQFIDNSVEVGKSYEYKVYKEAVLGYSGYGYLYTGIQVPPTESRGKVLVVVETNATAPLAAELNQFTADLMGDGWQVVRLNISSNQTPASVKSLITQEYYADLANVNAVFLFGRVPVFYSGSLNWDTHGARAMPADTWYGDVDGDWSASPSYLPSDVELMVGRVDFKDMPGTLGVNAWPSETELLRNYLAKNHAWRHALARVQRRALMGNRRGDEGGEATAASGYRHFNAFVGPGNTIEADIRDTANPQDRWIHRLGSGSFLWAYGCGGGQPYGISHLGTHGPYSDVLGADFRDVNARAAFVLLFGSYAADWQNRDNITRAVLASSEAGLACAMAGRPHWFMHHMGLGLPIGYSARISMNNDTLYQNQIHEMARAVYVSLMGDPTLRMDIVPPPGTVTTSVTGNSVGLNWGASAGPVLGYYVYKASSGQGPFTRITPEPVTNTSFVETGASPGTAYYRVRALALENHFSGSYYNLSQGVTASATIKQGTVSAPVTVRANRDSNGVRLRWNNTAGAVYRVQATDDLLSGSWVVVSGPISSDTDECTWLDTNGLQLGRGYYRVVVE